MYEFGFTTAGHEWVTVPLQQTYQTPIIITGLSSYNDSAVALTVIKNVTTTSFDVRVVEPPNIADDHADETIAYMVCEAGTGSINNIGAQYEAGSTITSNELVSGGAWVNVNGLILGQMMLGQVCVDGFTSNDFCKVKTRFSSNQWQAVLQNAEGNTTARANTKIYWVKLPWFYSPSEKIEAGQTPPEVVLGEFGISANPQVTNSWYTHTFMDTYVSAPYVISRITGMVDSNPAESRNRNIGTTTIEFKSEEDQNADSEQTHSAEYVGYIAFSGPSYYAEEEISEDAGDWGLKITLPGYSVWDATDNQTVFNSKYNIAKIVLEKSGFITHNEFGTGDRPIAHGQSGAPAFLTFIEGDDGVWVRGNGLFWDSASASFNPFNIDGSWSSRAGGYVTSDEFIIVNPDMRSTYILYLERKA